MPCRSEADLPPRLAGVLREHQLTDEALAGMAVADHSVADRGEPEAGPALPVIRAARPGAGPREQPRGRLRAGDGVFLTRSVARPMLPDQGERRADDGCACSGASGRASPR